MEITRTSAPSRSRRGRLSCENILPLAHTLIYLIPYFTHCFQSRLTSATASFETQTAQTVAKKRKLGKFSRLTQSTCCKFSLFFAITERIILGVVMGTPFVVRKAPWSEHECRKLQTPSEQLHSWLHFKAERMKKPDTRTQ